MILDYRTSFFCKWYVIGQYILGCIDKGLVHCIVYTHNIKAVLPRQAKLNPVPFLILTFQARTACEAPPWTPLSHYFCLGP